VDNGYIRECFFFNKHSSINMEIALSSFPTCSEMGLLWQIRSSMVF
jgi:hypothetical protein